MHQRLAPLLFTDEQPFSPSDPVAPAKRSASARAKAGSARTPDGHTAHSLADLIAELGTLCRNQLRIAAAEHTLSKLTTPTKLQTRAFELLNIKPHT